MNYEGVQVEMVQASGVSTVQMGADTARLPVWGTQTGRHEEGCQSPGFVLTMK
jgi:hypothetical protein